MMRTQKCIGMNVTVAMLKEHLILIIAPIADAVWLRHRKERDDMTTYKFTAEMDLKKIIADSREVAKALTPVDPQPSEHFIDGVHAIGYREGYKDAQKQKSGKWLITHLSNMAYCSECDYLFKDIPASVFEHFKYCPNCGAKMDEPQESEE